jgi:hypothetical protein
MTKKRFPHDESLRPTSAFDFVKQSNRIGISKAARKQLEERANILEKGLTFMRATVHIRQSGLPNGEIYEDPQGNMIIAHPTETDLVYFPQESDIISIKEIANIRGIKIKQVSSVLFFFLKRASKG